MASLYAKGGKLYLDFRWRGVRCQEATKLADTPSNRPEVRRRARVIAGEIAAGTFDYAATFPDGPKRALFAPPVTDDGPPLYADYARAWMQDRAGRTAKGTTYDEERMMEARILPSLGARPVDTITEEHIEHLVAGLKRGEAPSLTSSAETPKRKRHRPPMKLSNRRVNLILKLVRLSLDRAVRRGWLNDNPARAVPLLREEKPHIDPLDAEEVKRVLAHVDDKEDHRYFTVALYTGLRPGEEIGLEWERDVDWTKQRLQVRQTVGRFGAGPTKTADSARVVDMLPPVERELRAQRKASQLKGVYVFPNRIGGARSVTNMRRVWARALRKAGVRFRPMYQTRHTFASLMLGAGEAPAWIAGQMGQSLETFFRRYARFIPNLTRKDGSAATKWLAQEGL